MYIKRNWIELAFFAAIVGIITFCAVHGHAQTPVDTAGTVAPSAPNLPEDVSQAQQAGKEIMPLVPKACQPYVVPVLFVLLIAMKAGRFYTSVKSGADVWTALKSIYLGSVNGVKTILVLATASLMLTGCTLERRVTTINTPAVYDLHSNLVTAATSKTVTERERLWLPEGYVLMTEDDMFGIKVEMTSQSSALPNIIAGEHHGSLTWVPTSTNQMYAASISKQGSIDNKAVPFWMSSKAGITFGNAFITQNADTNAIPQSTAGASIPGTPTPQQQK